MIYLIISVVGVYVARTSSLNGKHSSNFSEELDEQNHTHIDHTFNQG